MELRGLCVAVLLAPALAHAQVAAAPNPHGEHVGLGGDLAVGAAYASGVGDAWVARLEYDAMPVLAPPRRIGPLVSFVVGYEYWRAGTGTWGFDLPAELELGLRAFPFRATVGVGADAMLVDQVRGDTGVGFWAPLASASAGFDVDGFTVMADARVTRRWQIGADDFTQWMFTLAIGNTWEGPAPKSGVR